MHKIRTIRGQIILLLSSLGFAISILVIILACYIIFTSQKRITIQSTEFNLSLVSNVIEQDLVNLAALSAWCSTNPTIVGYLDDPDPDIHDTLKAYNLLQEEALKNLSYTYVKRLIIVSTRGHDPLQIGAGIAHSYPLSRHNIFWLDDYLNEDNYRWSGFIHDPYSLTADDTILPYLLPVKSSENETIGYVFLAVHTAAITDKLRGYIADEDSRLYIGLGTDAYPISSHDTTSWGTSYTFLNHAPETLPEPESMGQSPSANSKSTISYIKQNNRKWVSVNYPVNSSISITQLTPTTQFLFVSKLWFAFLGLTVVIIVLFSLFIVAMLNKAITQPIIKLRKRMYCLGQGDFSVDPSIETNDELGEIGRGINRLSEDITVLLEKRLADEKNKRDLEYRMLQSQINPHFIYNTLASIKWMAVMQNADGIGEMTTALSHLMRSASKDTRTLVPLTYELQLLDDYMLIQNYRYGESICMVKDIDESLLETPIPRFSLQPIVENAIFHGIEPKGGGTIRLTISSEGNDILVSIRDDGIGITEETLQHLLHKPEQSSSMFQELGIQAVNTRIRYAFGNRYGLTITSEENNYTDMTIRLPKSAPQESEDTK